MGCALTIACWMFSGCGGGAAEPAGHDEAGGEATESVAASTDPTDPQVGAPASPECAAYLAHYRRCEGALSGEIAAGDRCSYEAEAIQKQLEDFRSTQLIWISAADSSSIRQFAQQHQLDQVPNVHWMSDTADVFAHTFGSSSVPSVWIYGQDGQLLKHYKGETKPAALLKYLHDEPKTRY